MFKLNDNVVYPGHGVAVISEIVEKTVGDSAIQFFKLDFLFKDMTILIPKYNTQSIGLRHLCSQQEIDKLLADLAKKTEKKNEVDFSPSGWNRRNKDYQAKIQSGNIFELAKIYRDLMSIAQTKELSFGERTLQQTTEELIAQELQVVQKLDRPTVVQELRSPFKVFTFIGDQSSQSTTL